MASHDNLAGAPGILELGGKTYMVGKAGHADLVTVRKKLKTKMPSPMKMLERIMAEPAWKQIPVDVQKELMKEAGQTQMRGDSPISDNMIFDLLSTDPELVALLTWTLIRKPMASVTLEEISGKVTEDNASEVLATLLEQSGLLDVEKNSVGLNGSQTRAMEA